jgi:bifunctional non-homologous end joining protein LigD
VKSDGFRAIVSTEGPLRVPVRAVLDGELVAFGEDGKPDFERVCECMLQRHGEIPLTFLAFDVLSVDGRGITHEPYSERRRLLEILELEGPCWRVPEAVDDGPGLWEAVSEQELEGVVAKRLHERYLPGERRWVKVKNREYWAL